MSIDKIIAQAQSETDDRIKGLLAENTRLRGELNKRESGSAVFERILDEVYEKPSGLTLLKPKRSTRSNKETALLHLTDVHYGKKTSTFNTAVCQDRMIQVCNAVDEIVHLRRKAAAINKIVVLLGGDMIEGQGIFPGQAYTTDASIIQQCIKDGPEMIANAIIHLCSIFPEVEVHATPGNHGRVDKHGHPGFNTDSILYVIVRGLVEKVAKNVTWNLPYDREPGKDWYAHCTVEGHGVALIHGDFKAGGANQLGYPWYSIGRRVAQWGNVLPDFSFLYVGHNHTWANFEVAGKIVLATGSVESSNDYAEKNFASAGEAHQRIDFYNERYGLLADHRIMLF